MTNKTYSDLESVETAAYSAPKLTRYGDMIEMTAASSNKRMNEGAVPSTMRNKV